MLISEVKELVKKYNENDLKLIITEMYKAMPKKLREEKDIDSIIKDVQSYMSIGKIEKKLEGKVEVKELKIEIDKFIDYAYKQYYFAPNSFIHKKERPKWRFKVKAYIKDLQGVLVDSEDGEIATELLEKLYEMLSYACGHYIFSTDNPFRSVGIDQTDLLNIVISRRISKGINKETIKATIKLVIDSEVDRETLHSSLINTLVSNLKSVDSKEICIQECMILKNSLEKYKSTNISDYNRKQKINYLVEIIFKLNMVLCEYDKAITYFNDNHIERDKEITLYILLGLLIKYNLKDYWLREYDKALKNGIEPRESLKKTQKYIQENGILPEYILY